MRPKNITLVSYNRFKAAFKAHSTARNRVRQEAFLIEHATTAGQVCLEKNCDGRLLEYIAKTESYVVVFNEHVPSNSDVFSEFAHSFFLVVFNSYTACRRF